MFSPRSSGLFEHLGQHLVVLEQPNKLLPNNPTGPLGLRGQTAAAVSTVAIDVMPSATAALTSNSLGSIATCPNHGLPRP